VVAAGAELPRTYLDALLQEGAIGLLLPACEGLEPRQLLLPLNLINRLVLTPQQAFSAQYIQVCQCMFLQQLWRFVL
jgi:hypothetical protein